MTRSRAAAAAIAMLTCGLAHAAEVEVKMLNKGSDGTPMAFEPALIRIQPGDSVHFKAVDKGHNVESSPGMAPEGTPPLKGKINDEPTVTFDKPGVYGFRCLPHYPMGMVALVVVGDPVNEDAAKAVNHPGLAKKNFAKLFADLDAGKR